MDHTRRAHATIIEPLFRWLTSLILIVGGLRHFGQHQIMLEMKQRDLFVSSRTRFQPEPLAAPFEHAG